MPQPGKQQFLNAVYVAPQISIRGFGGVDPSHEILAQTPKPIQVPSEDSFVALNDLFRLKKEDGSPVKTVVTTGIPGVGMSVSVAKFCLDWSEEKANRVRTDTSFLLVISNLGSGAINQWFPMCGQKCFTVKMVCSVFCCNLNFDMNCCGQSHHCTRSSTVFIVL